MIEPAKYASLNLIGTINILTQMVEKNISNFIFSSTAAVYVVPEISDCRRKSPHKPY